jgi:hypothetical protein
MVLKSIAVGGMGFVAQAVLLYALFLAGTFLGHGLDLDHRQSSLGDVLSVVNAALAAMIAALGLWLIPARVSKWCGASPWLVFGIIAVLMGAAAFLVVNGIAMVNDCAFSSELPGPWPRHCADSL